jgi:uncharacterized protein YuzE
MRTSYDRTTDSLYLELRPLPARRTVEMEEDVLVDIGEDGRPVGYDIQHASAQGTGGTPVAGARSRGGRVIRRRPNARQGRPGRPQGKRMNGL